MIFVKFILIYIVNYTICLDILLNCYINSKLANRLYKSNLIALCFIPFLSQHDTDNLDSGYAMCK